MRVHLLLVLLLSAAALNFETSLMSHTLAEVDALDTSQLNCQTPRSHFEELESTLTQWQHVLENKDRIPHHIETLTQMKHLIKHKKYDKLVEKLQDLDLIAPPVLSELKGKLQGLQSHDQHERKECTETLMKLCAYLIKQMGQVHQQCQQSPVTVIKVKGKIDDLKIIQSGCQQACQPTCDEEPDVPIPDIPEDLVDVPPTEEEVTPPEEEGTPEVPPTDPEVPPETPDTPETPEETTEPEETTPDQPPQPEETEEGVIEEPPVNPNTEESPEEVEVQEEEWEVPGEEDEVPEEETEVPPTEPEEQNPEDVVPPTEEGEEPVEPPVVPEPGAEEEGVEPIPQEELHLYHEEETPAEEGEVPEEPEVPAEGEEGEEGVTPPEPEVPVVPEEGEEFEEGTVPPADPNVEVPEGEETFEEEGDVENSPAPDAVPQECVAAKSSETSTFTATQESSDVVADIPVTGDYGFGIYFKWLQRWPENASGTKFHLASLSHEGRTVLGLYFTYEGVQCVTANGDGEEHVNVEFDDVEGDWGFAYISYGNGQTTCVVQYFEEQPQIRQTASTQGSVDSLHFQVGGSDGKHPSFQGQTYGQFAASGQVYVGSLKQYEQYVKACNPAPEEVCDRTTENLGEFEFFGNQEDAEEQKVEVNTWGDQYSVSGWFKWSEIADQEVWHTAFRLSSNQVASEDAVLGDRDLALYVGSEMVRSTLQFTTYTYTTLTGEGNPNLWQTVPYEDQLTNWHYIYFGYNRYEREAYVLVKFASHEVKLEFKDINHFVIPEKVLHIGQDGIYPAYSGNFYNFHVNTCDGAFELEPFTEPFGYIPPPPDVVPDPIVEPPEPESPEEFEEIVYEEEPEEPVPEEEEPEVPTTPEEEEPFEEGEEPVNPEEEQPEEPVNPEEEEPVEPEVPEEPKPEVPDEPVIPDEVKPVPKPEEPKDVPSEPQVPAVKECEATIEVTKENAADILCAISEYLAQLASGHVPELGINPSRVCFCLDYDDTEDNQSFMQIESLLQQRDANSLESLVVQRRRI